MDAFLPCNIIVYQDTGKVFFEAVDPEELTSVTVNEAVNGLVSEMKETMDTVTQDLLTILSHQGSSW